MNSILQAVDDLLETFFGQIQAGQTQYTGPILETGAVGEKKS